MASTSQEQKVHYVVSSTLDADIQALNDARDNCNITPAQDAFDASSALLTTIRVRPLPFRVDGLQAHIHAERHGQRTGLREPRPVLC
jgi:hypothetical protein